MKSCFLIAIILQQKTLGRFEKKPIRMIEVKDKEKKKRNEEEKEEAAEESTNIQKLHFFYKLFLRRKIISATKTSLR